VGPNVLSTPVQKVDYLCEQIAFHARQFSKSQDCINPERVVLMTWPDRSGTAKIDTNDLRGQINELLADLWIET
jgi:hypothetical protein